MEFLRPHPITDSKTWFFIPYTYTLLQERKMKGKSFLFFLNLVFATLHQISNGQVLLPTDMNKNEGRTLTETEWEILKQWSQHPQFIYSEFMKFNLNSARTENASQECLFDIEQVMRDLLSGKQYSVRSKCQAFFVFLSKEELTATH